MSPQEVITTCRRVHGIEGARWPMPLLAYLNDPSIQGHAFDWLCCCVGELLKHLGKASEEFDEAITFARREAAEGVDPEAMEKKAQYFWTGRSFEDRSITAVAQLLFTLSRADRSHPVSFVATCTTPIVLLERLESSRGEVLDLVISHFLTYVVEPAA